MVTKSKEVPVKKTAPAQTKAASPVPARAASPIASLREEVDRIFDRFSTGWPHLSWEPFKDISMPAGLFRGELSPRVDANESEIAYEITAELPGLEEKDIEVLVSDGALVIKGEKKDERKVDEKDYHLSERTYGSFRRSFRVPDGVDASKVAASFKNGVLTVSMPKSREAKSKQRKIAVSRG